MQRRELIKGAASFAALSSINAFARADEPAHASDTAQPSGTGGNPHDNETRKGDILYRKLGRTNEMVSAFGLGGYHIGTLKEEKDSIALIRAAIDHGINFMDNCWDYHDGKSEQWMGNALRDGYRDKVFLMTKIDGRTKEAAARQIDESLQRLQTDHIDLMQIHENIRMEDADRCFAPDGTIEALEAARQAGKIRFIGFTGHKDPLVHNRMLDVAAKHKFLFTTVQMPINVLDASFRSFTHDLAPRAVKEGIAILGMKPMASGAIVKNKIATPQECLTFALTMPTSVVITGMDSMKILEQNLEIMKNYKPMPPDEQTALLNRTRDAAESGKYELFKTASVYDGTANHPEWLG